MNDGRLVLVTGGTGHLGGHTVVRLLADGYRVRAKARNVLGWRPRDTATTILDTAASLLRSQMK